MKKIIARILIIAMLIAFASTALAAKKENICKKISGNAKKSVTFTIETDETGWFKDYVTFNNYKGHFENPYHPGGLLTQADFYWCYKIKICELDKNGKRGRTWWEEMTGSSKKIKLDKGGTEYEIKVIPFTTAQMEEKHMFKSILIGGEVDWDSNTAPRWDIKRTNGITLCQ